MPGAVQSFGRPNDQFTIIANAFLRDDRIKPSAFRIAVYVLSHSANFRLTQGLIASVLGMNETTIRRAFKELEELRYLVRVPTRDERGHRAADDLYLSQEPFTDELAQSLPGNSQGWESQAGESQHWDSPPPKKSIHSKKTKEQEDHEETSPPGDGGLFPADPEDLSRKSIDLDLEFEGWWKQYPRKVGKGQALRAYKGARKGASLEELANGLRRASIAWEAARTAPQYVPHASTWLNGQRWLDDPAAIAHAGDARGAYRNDAWDRDAAAERDEDGYTEEDRMIMEKYGAKIGYGNSNAPAK